MKQSRLMDYLNVFLGPTEFRLRQCRELESEGPIGRLASLLYRALNACMLVDLYENVAPLLGEPPGGCPQTILERKMHETAALLSGSSDYCFVPWGWKRDDRCRESPWVMVIELPTGNVQCWVPHRGTGPSYDRELDYRQANVESITLFFEDVLRGGSQTPADWHNRW